MAEYTGPTGPSDVEWFQWYHRLVDAINPVHQRGWAICCNPKDSAVVKDFLERIKEDAEAWAHPDVPDLYLTTLCPEGQVRPFDRHRLRPATMTEVMRSRTGFGRFGGLLLPTKEGLADTWRLKRDGS